MKGFRRTLTTLFVASGAVVLAACASGKPATFHPEGGVPPVASSAPATPASGFASAVHLEWETALPSSEPQRQVMQADEAFWLAFYHTLYTHGRDQGYLADVAKAQGRTVTKNGATFRAGSYGLSYLAGDVVRYRQQNHGIQGTVVFSDTTIAPDPGNRGAWDVSGCVNDSKLPDTKAGRVLRVTGGAHDHYYYQTDELVKQHGRWLLANWTLVAQYPEGKAQQCMQ